MKQPYLVLLLVLAIASQTALAQQVEYTQRSLITKRTATWCPNCGSWGWTFFHDLISDNHDKALFFAAHYSGALETGVAADLTNNFGGSYQPEFFFDHIKQPVTPFSMAQYRDYFKHLTDSAYVATPTANSTFTANYYDGAIHVDATIEFFKEAEGDFFFGVYLVEDHVMAYQQGQGNNADHRYVLQASFTPDSFGELLTSGTITAGSTFQKKYALSIGDPTGYDYHVYGIIWKKAGSKYELVNVWGTDDVEIGSPSTELKQLALFRPLPNVGKGHGFVELSLEAPLAEATIDVLDSQGRPLQVLHRGALSAGEHRLAFDLGQLPAGTYLIRLRSSQGQRIQRLIIQ